MESVPVEAVLFLIIVTLLQCGFALASVLVLRRRKGVHDHSPVTTCLRAAVFVAILGVALNWLCCPDKYEPGKSRLFATFWCVNAVVGAVVGLEASARLLGPGRPQRVRGILLMLVGATAFSILPISRYGYAATRAYTCEVTAVWMLQAHWVYQEKHRRTHGRYASLEKFNEDARNGRAGVDLPTLEGYRLYDITSRNGTHMDASEEYGVCAAPATYGITGFKTLIADSSGQILWKDLRGKPTREYPMRPRETGWLDLDATPRRAPLEWHGFANYRRSNTSHRGGRDENDAEGD
jgi:hypothetical protein